MKSTQKAGGFFSAVVTDFHLSHLAWLKSPMEAADLATMELLATCYAVMRPREGFWSQFLNEVDRLRKENKVSSRDHEVLRFSASAPDEVMEVTRGDIEGLNEKNIHVIVERLEKEYAREKQGIIEELSAKHEEAQVRYREAAERAAIHEKLHLDASKRAEELNRNIEQVKRRELAVQERISVTADSVALVAYAFSWGVFVVAGAMSVFSNFNALFAIPAALLGVFNIAAGFSGTRIREFVKTKVEAALRKFVE